MMRNKFFVPTVIFVVGFLISYFYAVDIKSVYGGDFYNFIFIGKSILSFNNPFVQARRLPVYPVLLTPSIIFDFLDTVIWGRILNIGLASLAGSLTYLILFEVGIPLALSFITSLLVINNLSFLLISLRPLAHAVLTFFVMLSLYLARKKDTYKNLFVLSIVLGATSMVRQEGFVLSATVIGFKLFGLKDNFKLKKIMALLTPYALIVSPYFISNLVIFGNPIYSDYANDPALPAARSLAELIRNANHMLNNLMTLWFSRSYKVLSFIFVVFLLSGSIKMLKSKRAYLKTLAFSFWLLFLTSLLLQPGIRYWHQFIPLTAIISLYGLYSLVIKNKSLRYKFTLLILSLLSIPLLVRNHASLTKEIARGNSQHIFDHLIRKAIKALPEEGRVGFASDFPQAVYSLSERGVFYTIRPPKHEDLETQEQWLIENSIDYFVWDSKHNYFNYFQDKKYLFLKEYQEEGLSVRIYEVKI